MAQPGIPANLSDRRWVILSVVAVAQLMVVLDSTIVNIALPSAQRALGSGVASALVNTMQQVGGAFEGAPLLLLRTAGAPTERRAQARHDRQPHDPQRSSAMTNGPAHSQRQAIPVDDPKPPPLDEAARRTFIARSVALAPRHRTELLLPGAQR